MDPIRTAVKYSLMPIRAVVALGEHFISRGEPADVPTPRPAPAEPAAPRSPQPRPRRATRQQAAPRAARPSPQASQAPKDLDDVALARKVETIIFRDAAVPKGQIDVNCADGVVWLRGEAKTPAMIKALERQTAAIPEVVQVENLLHLPKTPAPTRTDTPATQRRTRSSTKRPSAARKVTTTVTNEGQGVPASPLETGNGGGSEPGA
jgi:hypothetical protein